jgi:hypothetical protein
MLNPFSTWLFNTMVWGAIFALVALITHVYVTPIITGVTALIGLGAVAVLSLFWPKY